VNKQLDWYIEALKHEFEQCTENRYTGNIEFKVNWKEGAIGNLNLGLHKSLQAPKNI